MNRNRLLVFARRPAPVQVTFAGYPGTTGLDAIDYRITDRWLDPADCNDDFYSEKSIRLPCFWCYDPFNEEPAVNELPALASGQITFGCFNSFAKVNTHVLALWSRVLRAVPKSRILILCEPGSHRKETQLFLNEHGVAEENIEFINKRTRPEYLSLHHRMDIALDTFPYNGHTTSSDALWMGIPVVSLAGTTPVSRGGLSLLSNLELQEFAAGNEEEHVRIAVKLASDLPRLADLRRSLRQRMQRSPLMDGRLFARNIEAAFRTMWQGWCEAVCENLSGGQSSTH